jgi:hypothetical protein
MDVKNFIKTEEGNLYKNEEIYRAESDEEVLNCEGSPCSFTIKPE